MRIRIRNPYRLSGGLVTGPEGDEADAWHTLSTNIARETPDSRASYRGYRSCPEVEDVLTDEDLAALMEAREHEGWPAELAGGVYGMPSWLIRYTG